jgi:hypothetical protein
MQTWGKAGTVMVVKEMTAKKMDDCSIIRMFVGYTDNHDGDIY